MTVRDVIGRLAVAVDEASCAVLHACTPCSRDVLPNTTSHSRTVLFVTAHPDDEAMFFAPSILRCLAQGRPVHLLCLSDGGFLGPEAGARRVKELRAACEVLGLAPGSLTVHRSPSLPDSPYKGDTWLFSEVAHVVVAKAKEIQAGAVVTFDADGVTGHPNHVACRTGVMWARKALEAGGAGVWTLATPPVWVRFTGLLGAVACAAWGRAAGSSAVWTTSVTRAWTAMACHASQAVWYRRLYMAASVLVLCNVLVSQRDRGVRRGAELGRKTD